MKKYRGFRILMLKAYFDKGLGLTNYFKYLLAFAGIFQFIDAKQGMVLVVTYVIGCFVLGYFWYKLKLTDTENEINNIFNPFVKEVRNKLH